MDLIKTLKEIEDCQNNLINCENKLAHYFLGLSEKEISEINLEILEKCLPVLKNSLLSDDYGKVYHIFSDKSLSQTIENKFVDSVTPVLYYPILKNMKTVDEKQRLVLDEVLSHYKKNQFIYYKSPICKPLRLFMTDDVWNELYDLGVVEINYRYTAECACPLFAKTDINLVKKDYDDLKSYLSGDLGNFDEKRIEEIVEILENCHSYCDSCEEEFEIKELRDLDNYIEIEYRLLLDRITK